MYAQSDHQSSVYNNSMNDVIELQYTILINILQVYRSCRVATTFTVFDNHLVI